MIDYLALEKKYELGIYAKRDIVLVKGEDAKVWDQDGKEYIDCVAGLGVGNVGHSNKKVAEAISEQVRKLMVCSNLFANDVRALLLEKLVNIAPKNLTHAFLCNSGAESVEAAIKFARFVTQKTDFVCAVNGFHGRTMGALSATYKPKYRDDFKPLIPGFHHVPFNDFEKLEETVSKNTAGIILEIVQGEGGINIGREEYFRSVKALCESKKILLIIDEVQTGFGRTGRMFACDHFDLKPDMLCLAKSIAGGIPMGAVVCSEKIEIPVGKHGSTFGGNPVACAGALAAIDFIIENKLDEQARDKGDYFVRRLKKFRLNKIKEIRYLGLMIGIELKNEVKPVIFELMDKGILVFPAGSHVIRLLPPLTISYEELDIVAEKLGEVLG